MMVIVVKVIFDSSCTSYDVTTSIDGDESDEGDGNRDGSWW